MSPADAFSPPNTIDNYALSGFTPYSTTSPAYISGGGAGGGGMNAASPISAALAHGTRVLSGIQAGSPWHGGTPAMPQGGYGGPRYPVGMQGYGNGVMQGQGGQGQQVKTPVVPEQGSPEYLRLALGHLQNTLLARLEADCEGFFDAA